eukprot:jgi/Psemu1/59664/gm1.59664_g
MTNTNHHHHHHYPSILVQLIRQRKYRLALQRVYYFPGEAAAMTNTTITTITTTNTIINNNNNNNNNNNANLALHEVILGLSEMPLQNNHHNNENNHLYHENNSNKDNEEEDDQVALVLALIEALIRAYPEALATHGSMVSWVEHGDRERQRRHHHHHHHHESATTATATATATITAIIAAPCLPLHMACRSLGRMRWKGGVGDGGGGNSANANSNTVNANSNSNDQARLLGLHLAVVRLLLKERPKAAGCPTRDAASELPLHILVRWMLGLRLCGGERRTRTCGSGTLLAGDDAQEMVALEKGEEIAVSVCADRLLTLLIVAHPKGATIPDGHGITPLDLLRDYDCTSYRPTKEQRHEQQQQHKEQPPPHRSGTSRRTPSQSPSWFVRSPRENKTAIQTPPGHPSSLVEHIRDLLTFASEMTNVGPITPEANENANAPFIPVTAMVTTESIPSEDGSRERCETILPMTPTKIASPRDATNPTNHRVATHKNKPKTTKPPKQQQQQQQQQQLHRSRPRSRPRRRRSLQKEEQGEESSSPSTSDSESPLPQQRPPPPPRRQREQQHPNNESRGRNRRPQTADPVDDLLDELLD